jgi:hypothetical protein
MNTLLKWFLAVAGILTGLFLLLALGVYFFVDINHYKKDLEQLVKAETGHELKLISSVDAKGSSLISQLRTHLRIKKSIARMEDVALATAKHRMAFKGEVDLRQHVFKNFLVATVDEKGCALYEESITGTFDAPRAEKVNLLVKGVINPIASVLSKVTDPIIGRCQTPFYTGGVKSP